MRRLAHGSLLWLAIGVGVVACRQIAGIEDRSIGGDDAGTDFDASVDVNVDANAGACGIAFGAPACQVCADQQCCDKVAACVASPSCNAYERCLAACAGVATCRSQCAIDNPVATIESVPRLDQCLAAHCRNECGLECGGLVWNYVPEATNCAPCVHAAACGNETACAMSVSCQAYVRCRLACRTDDCLIACGSTYRSNVNDFYMQANSSCRTDCRLGGSWWCVGRVTWPLRKAPDIGVSVTITSPSDPASVLDGLNVKMCVPSDSDCTVPIDRGVTDPSGMVLLVNRSQAPNGFLEISSPSMAIVPLLHYWSFPFSEQNAGFYLPVFVFAPTSIDTVMRSLGIQNDPTRGHLLIHAYDCDFRGAFDVVFDFAPGRDASSQSYYTDLANFSTTATATGQSGYGGFVNVPPGKVTVTATPKSLGRPSTSVSVFVRAGAFTFVEALPTP